MAKIHQKLQSVRVALQNTALKKTGLNTYNQLRFFELADFLPTVEKLMLDNKISSSMELTRETATLTFHDFDADDKITFSCPVDVAEINGGKTAKVQLMGATITYYRRYLAMMAFEIVEMDEVDSRIYENNFKEPVEKTPYTLERAQSMVADWQSKKMNPATLLTGIKGKHTIDAEVETFIFNSLEGG